MAEEDGAFKVEFDERDETLGEVIPKDQQRAERVYTEAGVDYDVTVEQNGGDFTVTVQRRQTVEGVQNRIGQVRAQGGGGRDEGFLETVRRLVNTITPPPPGPEIQFDP